MLPPRVTLGLSSQRGEHHIPQVTNKPGRWAVDSEVTARQIRQSCRCRCGASDIKICDCTTVPTKKLKTPRPNPQKSFENKFQQQSRSRHRQTLSPVVHQRFRLASSSRSRGNTHSPTTNRSQSTRHRLWSTSPLPFFPSFLFSSHPDPSSAKAHRPARP